MHRRLPSFVVALMVACAEDPPTETADGPSGITLTPSSGVDDGAAGTGGATGAGPGTTAGPGSTTTPTSDGSVPTTTQGETATGTGTSTDGATTGGEPTSGMPVVPVDSGTGVAFEGGGYRLTVSQAGGRITEYSLDGVNVLSTTGDPMLQQGSTLWVAPQALWNWPPLVEHDSNPYSYAIEGNEAVFTGQEALGVAFTKRFGVSDDGTVSIRYTLLASTPPAQAIAPWEISRLAPTLCFFGTGPEVGQYDYGTTTQITPVPGTGITWVPFQPGNTAQQTLLADGIGWSGCATGPGGLLFVKRFTDVPASAFSAGNGEIKIWWEGNAFLELEQMGPSSILAAGVPVTWDVQWNLARLAPEVVVEAGSPSLAALLPQ